MHHILIALPWHVAMGMNLSTRALTKPHVRFAMAHGMRACIKAWELALTNDQIRQSGDHVGSYHRTGRLQSPRSSAN